MIGMLWHDSDPQKSPDQKISEAIAHFIKKYQQQPTRCAMRSIPADLQIPGLLLESDPYILPADFWIGNESETLK